MKLGIIGAMDEEIERLRSVMQDCNEQQTGGCTFYTGTMEDISVVVVKSGIGKVNAAIATTLLIEQYHPDDVVNCGTAGGFHKDLKVADVVISTEVRYHDVDATAFGYEYGQVPQMPPLFEANAKLIELAVAAARQIPNINVMEGLIASADSFMDDAERIAFVTSKFPDLLAADMEAAAIGQVCSRFGVPFVIIRSLSDIAGQDSGASFDRFLQTASKHSAEVIQAIVSEL